MEEFRHKVIKTLPTFILNDQLPITPQEIIEASPRSSYSHNSNGENEFNYNDCSDMEKEYEEILSKVNSQVLRDQTDQSEENVFQPLTNISINGNRRRKRSISSSKKKLADTTNTSQVNSSFRSKRRQPVRAASARRAKTQSMVTSRHTQIQKLLNVIKEYIKEENSVVLKNRIKRAGLFKLIS